MLFSPRLKDTQEAFLLLTEVWSLLTDAIQGEGVVVQYPKMEGATPQIAAHALSMVLLEQYDSLKKDSLIFRYTPSNE